MFFINNGAAEFYYDNSKKLETTSNGVDINSTGSGNGLLRINGASGNTEGIIIQRDGTEASRISHSNSADLIFSMGSSVATKLKLTLRIFGTLFLICFIVLANSSGIE